ncbi:helix-turn-helix transcriptional regulator [Streptomyces sp. H51]|uniref:helix-turn-helix transcriptional regulator n=1 Tax=Streptomyces sp. H51 TaxID=3111770 RepID=UPI002D77F8E9|nr:helix-turn-helix transcriptional regulator [Streptomyces sp. H51]
MSIISAGFDLNYLLLEGYQHVVEYGRWDGEKLAERTGATSAEIREARRVLTDLRVIEPESDHGTWRAVSPRVAMAKLMTPIDKEVQRRVEDAENLRARLQALLRTHQEMQRLESRDIIQTMTDGKELDQLIEEEVAGCSTEVLFIQQRVDHRLLGRKWLADAGGRGVRVRAVFQHAARYHLPSEGFMDTATRSGAEIRTVGEVPLRMVVIDRSVCVLRVPEALEAATTGTDGEPRAGGEENIALAVRNPVLVSVLAAAFEETWNRASSYTCTDPQPSWLGDELVLAIMRLMATGMKDDAIARRLGVSLRTCRRHVSDLMQNLGASSRFQAGVEARRRLLV